jgi:hypothetical protein
MPAVERVIARAIKEGTLGANCVRVGRPSLNRAHGIGRAPGNPQIIRSAFTIQHAGGIEQARSYNLIGKQGDERGSIIGQTQIAEVGIKR